VSARTVPIDLLLASIAFAQTRGWDVDDLLGEAGISPVLLAEGRSRVTEEQLTGFVQELWRQTDDEMFGLGAHPLPRGSMRLLCYGLVGAQDLGGLLDRFQGLARAMPALPPLTVTRDGDLVRLSFTAPRSKDPELDLNAPLPVCVGLAVLHRLIAWAIGGRLPLVAVEVPYPRQLEEAHDLVFASPLLFDAAAPAIVFDAAGLQTPVMRSEAELDAFIADSPAGLLVRPAHESTVTDQVRRMVELAIRASGPNGVPSGDEVAARLSISQQTLRRRLAEAGTSLREIRDQVLRDAAIMSLVDGDESIADLAARLGFSEPSAFTRAFRRWTGNPPSAYRAGISAATEPPPG
jgi:AraC-like DNA-binding protein